MPWFVVPSWVWDPDEDKTITTNETAEDDVVIVDAAAPAQPPTIEGEAEEKTNNQECDDIISPPVELITPAETPAPSMMQEDNSKIIDAEEMKEVEEMEEKKEEEVAKPQEIEVKKEDPKTTTTPKADIVRRTDEHQLRVVGIGGGYRWHDKNRTYSNRSAVDMFLCHHNVRYPSMESMYINNKQLMEQLFGTFETMRTRLGVERDLRGAPVVHLGLLPLQNDLVRKLMYTHGRKDARLEALLSGKSKKY